MTKISVVMPVKIMEEWQAPMTRCAIDTLRCTTDIPFELIVAESGIHPLFSKGVDRHIHCKGDSVNEDTNEGFYQVTGDYTVYTANDIMVRPGWLEALLQCFEIEDCGIATLASSDLNMTPSNCIIEGIYGPFMMFENIRVFNHRQFPQAFGDTDLIMQIYKEGKRSYRNHNVIIQHAPHTTLGHGDFDEARLKFIEKWSKDPVMRHTRLFYELAGIQI